MKFAALVRSGLCALLLSPFMVVTPPAGQAQSGEYRAMWVDAWGAGFLNASQVNTLVNRCTTYNYNAVFVQMRRRGDAFYMPQAPNGDPRTTALASGYDALQDLITKCHAANPPIQVHVWVTSQLIWSGTTAPPQSGHVYNQHPAYLTENLAGAKNIAEGYYLDPGHPGAMLWNQRMAMDIVSRYDIDGFQWDYIRYPQQDSGYNPTAVARYNAEFGLSGKPAANNAQWSTWRRRQITDFLRTTNADLLAVKPNLIISTAVFGSRSDAYTHRLQDWSAWNSEGLVDLCLPMNYASSNSTFNSRVDDAFNHQGIRWVIMGQGAYLNTASNTVTQLNYAKNKGLKGTSLYSYRVPNSGTVNQTGTFATIKSGFQPTYVAPPSIPWKASPTKGIARGTITAADTGQVVYNANLSINTSPAKTQKSTVQGKYAFYEVPSGTYTVTATAPGYGTATGSVTVVAGQVRTRNLVLPVLDTTPPVISNVQATGISTNGATITWTTNENASSRVNYGLTTSYGSNASNGTLKVNHSIALSGLSANTTYNYRVRSTDAAGNEKVSGNYTFKTLANNSPIVIDNSSSNFSASANWTLATSATDKYGANYRYRTTAAVSDAAQWNFTVPSSGNYTIKAWWSQGTNRSATAPFILPGGGGTVSKNMQTGGGAWQTLGNVNLSAGTHNVRLSCWTTAGYVVIADAIRVEP